MAHTQVDLSEGSFIIRDESTPLTHIYNSRSIHQGLLGLGWCTPYEDSLDVRNKSVIKLRDCKLGKVISYHLKTPSLRSPSSVDRVYESGNQKIIATSDRYIDTSDSVRAFDKNGRLLVVKDERGKRAQLIYDKNGYLKEIISGRKDSLKLMVDPQSGRIVEEIDPQGARTRLTFLNGSLISSSHLNETKFYTYDKVLNITEIKEGKKTTSVLYNNDDQVISVKSGENCTESYKYTSPILNPRTEVMTNCKGINNKRLVDFSYSKKVGGEPLLEKVSVHSRSSVRVPASQPKQIGS